MGYSNEVNRMGIKRFDVVDKRTPTNVIYSEDNYQQACIVAHNVRFLMNNKNIALRDNWIDEFVEETF